ncbi:helix-turn-helix domain-containing protein [Aliarcobacter butzleri]|uniref:helix-turn-helix domain-containing protein n=1 Tax=Aliarcobacter butzleri TaxID=28197 RepID=UPI00125FD345|nr:helix-turn-helix domain-containing protein [Aliarcobacter butzleri]
MSKNENNLIFITLYRKYNKMMLSKKEVANELGISLRTLNRRIEEKAALPSYTKNGGIYLFPLENVAKYITALGKL